MKKLLLGLLIFGLAIVGLMGAGGIWLLQSVKQDLPAVLTPEEFRPWVTTKVHDRRGQLIAEFFEERRRLIPIEEMSLHLRRAFVAAEDGDFYRHKGFSVMGIARAAYANFRAGRVVQGGSTITQQVAKSFLPSQKRTVFRKLQDLILAREMEKSLTKDQILYLYLNQIYLGHGAYGVEAASQIYFKKPASQLTIAEAALLAGLPQAPSRYSPVVNPQLAKARQVYVIRRMFEEKFISREEAIQAATQQLKVHFAQQLFRDVAPHYSEMVRRLIVQRFGSEKVNREGLIIKTTMDLDLQRAAQKSVQEGVRQIERRQGYMGPIQRLPLAEVPEFLEKQRQSLQDEVFDYRIISGLELPQGSKASASANQETSPDEEEKEIAETVRTMGETVQDLKQIIPTDRLVQAVVEKVTEKEIDVSIAGMKFTILEDHWKWARPRPGRGEIKRATESGLAPGDVVWVMVQSFNHQEPKTKRVLATASLEQVPELQGALYAVEPKTGAVVSVVGGYDFQKSEFNRAIQAVRQPGSTFKTFIFSAAIDLGWTPASPLVDSPLIFESIKDDQIAKWKPENYESGFTGDTTLAEALMLSRNIPTIKLLQEVGLNYMLKYLQLLGIRSPMANDLTLSLGSSGLTLAELTKAYAVFANQGRRVRPYFIEEVRDRDGKVILSKDQLLAEQREEERAMLESFPATLIDPQSTGLGPSVAELPVMPFVEDPDQLISPQTNAVVVSMLQNVTRFGTGAAMGALGRTLAGKTGTTNGNVDALFVGFTPNLVTGVWVGHDSEKNIGVGENGGRAAGPIWLDYMRAANGLYPQEPFPLPEGTVEVVFRAKEGVLSRDKVDGKSTLSAVFKEGSQPSRESPAARSLQIFRDDEE